MLVGWGGSIFCAEQTAWSVSAANWIRIAKGGMTEQLEEALDNEVLAKRNGAFVSAWGSTVPTGGKDSDAKDSVATRTAKRQTNQRSILENAKSIFLKVFLSS